MKKFHKQILSVLIFTGLLISDSVNAQMYWNHAGSFAGNSSSYISVPNSASLELTGSFTLEAWINPTIVTGIAKGIISKGGVKGTSLKYALRILNGRISLSTNGAQRLISKASTSINSNVWTHVAANYNSSLDQFQIMINGSLDTSCIISGAAPTSNPDSLFIGISGTSTPFPGLLDEVRIWNTSLSSVQIFAFMKTSMGICGDFTSGNLVLSIPFQNNTGEGTIFSVMDYSDNLNNGNIRNVTGVNLSDRPSGNHHYSDCIFFPSTPGFLSGQDNPSISPVNKMTIEFWIYPKTDNYGILYKGSYTSLSPDYGMTVTSGKLNAYINNTLITSTDSVKKERWSHIAFTYFGTTGRFEFYVNGKRGTSGNIAPGNINDGNDSLIIGSFPSLAHCTGYLDEFRISHEVKSSNDINAHMFSSINESNDNDAVLNAVYNFDGSNLPNTNGGPRLYFRGNISYNFNGAFFSESRLSPVINFSPGQSLSGYYLNYSNKRIPASGSSGTIKDTIEILNSEIISDLNIFVAINHRRTENLKITITNPIGASAEIFANFRLLDSNDNIVTIFDSDADSSLLSNKYVNFGPKIKPLFDINAIYGGSNSKGKWILSVTDEGGSDTGFISGWGLQINNKISIPFNLECTGLLEGIYNPASNSQIPDTMRYYLRSGIFPYSIIDSSKSAVNSAGTGNALFTKAQTQTDYFLVLKHRNSIETWSSSLIKFSQFNNQAQYNFSDISSKAFGDNMKQVDTSPIRYGFYGGDVNQDGTIDLTDGSLIDNDAFNFISGYVPTDINGDGVTDLADAVFADNNAFNFVSKITP
ncbi:MAG: proprotein convertase P-domain-containing protein [Bacteroidetes bacterium]|nr:proprotein convertase P-domain-containing protein [Bacteroidota bacterium]